MDGRRPDPRDVARPALLLAALLGLPAAAQSAAQSGTDQLHALEAARSAEVARAREAAARQGTAEFESRRLAAARVAAAASLRTLESATAEAAATMDGLARRRAAAESRLAARAAELAPLLPLTLRLSLYPAETLLAVPRPPAEALTGILVLRGMARQLETEAEALRAEQAEVARLTQGMNQQERRLSEAQAAQATQSASLDRQIAEAHARGQAAEDAGAEAARRAAEQAAQADSLRAALAQLELSRRQAETQARADAASALRHRRDAAAQEAQRRQVALVQPAGPGLDEARGQLGAPVAGAVVKAYGEPGDGGPATGVSFGAAPGARVSAPCGGRVAFAGPFRSFGQLLILDCGGGYHFVLAGMERLDAAVGRQVQAGEPVGVMAAWDPRVPGTRPKLYVELRQNGQPINPAPYLRARS